MLSDSLRETQQHTGQPLVVNNPTITNKDVSKRMLFNHGIIHTQYHHQVGPFFSMASPNYIIFDA